MSKPKFRYELQKESQSHRQKYDTGSFPAFEDVVKKHLEELGEDNVESDTIIIRKIKQE